jgi:hypothetical protein
MRARTAALFTLLLLSAGHSEAADRPAVHGMLMVGSQRLYFSHLPMFMAPHEFQVILEIRLSGNGTNPEGIYRNDRQTTGTKVYTFVPEPMVLSTISQAGKHFTGVVYRGHFERGGVPITQRVTATVERVVHFRRFQAGTTRPPAQQYLLFGAGTELFMAHLIWTPPDFDQVLSVQASPLPQSAATLGGVLAALPGVAPTAQLKEGSQHDTVLNSVPTHLTTGTQWYVETGDLEQ